MNTSIITHYLRIGVALVTTTLITQVAYAQSPLGQGSESESPAVQGPESVLDWWNAGERFIEANRRLHRNNRRAKNVILFVGDGMGISTITAARFSRASYAARKAKRTAFSLRRCRYVALSKTLLMGPADIRFCTDDDGHGDRLQGT